MNDWEYMGDGIWVKNYDEHIHIRKVNEKSGQYEK